MKLTKLINGVAALDAAAFPGRAQETLDREMNAFSPFREVVQRLAKYEGTGLEPSEANRLAKNKNRAEKQMFGHGI